MGLGEKATIIHIIDFGLAKQYKDPRNGRHIPFRSGKQLTGTARYASINTHLGFEQSRRDDLEGVFNVIVYFLRGSLPWQGLPGLNKNDKYKRIMDVKVHTTVETLCQGLPSKFALDPRDIGELCAIINYCRKLDFEDEPNYAYIKQLLKDAFTMNHFAYDFQFDWTHHSSPRLSQTQFSLKSDSG